MMIMTTKSPSIPCHIIVSAVPKFAILSPICSRKGCCEYDLTMDHLFSHQSQKLRLIRTLRPVLSEESEYDASGNR